MAASDSDIYEAVFDLCRAIAVCPDLETLYNALAASLRRLVSFDSLGLILYDPLHDQLRLHLNANSHQRNAIVLPVDDNHVGATVWREQKPLVLSSLGAELPQGDGLHEAFEHGLQAVTWVPLSNGDHRLGILGFGFSEPYQPNDQALAFLQRVSSEFAVAVDSFLARRALQQERDRMRALFDITTALIPKLPTDELLPAVSEELNRVVAHDFALVALLETSTGELHLKGLHWPTGMQFPIEETSIRPEGLPLGEALATGKPVVTTGLDFERFPAQVYRKYAGENQAFLSSCTVPLTSGNGISGVLYLARQNDDPFTNDQVDLLVQVARQIAIAIENSLAYRELSEIKDRLATEKLYLEDEIRFDQNVSSMIGEGPAFQAVLRSIRLVAPTDATVLIQGETGTGKELVARAIHDVSGRSKQSFIKVNCATIPATLLESELFGHEKGSFTGAFAQKIGRFELAHQGTLFLDEIGEIPLELQSKLLRAIQEQELERLGGNRTIRVNVRFVAATNRNLKQMVDEGKFRSDLYYRLHVFPLIVPSLRERKEDIPLLIRYFTQKHAKRMNRTIEEIPSASIEALMAYDWPGNIRELQNIIERSVILSSGQLLQIVLPEPIESVLQSSPASQVAEAVERERILQALRESGGKVAGPQGAAARLGIRRTTLQSRMKRLNIEREYR